MKKTITLILAAAMLISCFAGCSPQDRELYGAISQTLSAENYTKTVKITPRLTINEPVSNNETSMGEAFPDDKEYSWEDTVYAAKSDNDFLNAIADAVNDIEITAVSKRDSSREQLNVLAAKSDIEAEATLWSEKTEDDNIKYTAKIPSYLFSEKDYAVISSKDIAEGNNKKIPAGMDTSLIENVLSLLTDNLNTSLTAKDSDGAYVLKLNDSALDSLTKELLSFADNSLALNLITTIIYAQMKDEDVTFEEIQAAYKEALPEIEASRSDFFKELKDCGVAAEGLSCKYYPGNDGLIDKTEGTLSFAIDLKTDFGQSFYQEFFPNGYSFDYVPSGKFTFDISFTESYSYGGAKIELPNLTEENTLDLGKQYIDCKNYKRKQDENYNTWMWYYEEYNINPAEPLKIVNTENGKEIESFAFLSGGNIYFPLTELAFLYDGMEISWNSDLMGVVIHYPQSLPYNDLVLLNADGLAMFEEYSNNEQFNSETGNWEYHGDVLSPETVELFENGNYNFYNLTDSGYFDENGKAYVDLDDFTSALDYVIHIEGNTVQLADWDTVFSTPDEMYDNFFYKYF